MPGEILPSPQRELEESELWQAETSQFPGNPSNPRRPFTRRSFLTGAGITLAGLFVYASEISRHELEVVRRTIPIRNLPDSFEGFRIVQISDIHFEEFTEDTFLHYAVHRINALQPDMVLLTGDYVSNGPRPPAFALEAAHRCGAILSRLQCPLRFASLGNHDINVGSVQVLEALSSNGLHTLVNQYVPIERDGQRFWLSGLDDAGPGQPNLDLAIPPHLDGPMIMMCHEPDYADTIVRHPRGALTDLILSGHTHGGQVRFPFVPPVSLPPMGKKYVEGLFHLNQSQLYVNRGLGTVGLPVRFNCPPELTLITLQSSAA